MINRKSQIHNPEPRSLQTVRP